ncbi:hypothetical protein O3P69_008646 [Scylla paramamosain]|uniref:Uncharacterized protein n=1 Tax=Scylla paramamosain TaxID=85552 RepID=A0AAW0SMS7_SCYPA
MRCGLRCRRHGHYHTAAAGQLSLPPLLRSALGATGGLKARKQSTLPQGNQVVSPWHVPQTSTNVYVDESVESRVTGGGEHAVILLTSGCHPRCSSESPPWQVSLRVSTPLPRRETGDGGLAVHHLTLL